MHTNKIISTCHSSFPHYVPSSKSTTHTDELQLLWYGIIEKEILLHRPTHCMYCDHWQVH